MYGTEITDEAPSSALLSAHGDKYQGKVTYILNDKGILSWVSPKVIIESHCNVEILVAKPMCCFLVK